MQIQKQSTLSENRNEAGCDALMTGASLQTMIKSTHINAMSNPTAGNTAKAVDVSLFDSERRYEVVSPCMWKAIPSTHIAPLRNDFRIYEKMLPGIKE